MTSHDSILDYESAKPPRRRHRYLLILTIVFTIWWLAWAINPKYFKVWVIENALCVGLMVFLALTYRRFPLSNVSYTLIAIFLAFHTVGAHYTYSEVPYKQWAARIGIELTAQRNHFDRLVHFLYGLLMAYPVREMFLRIANVKGFWGYYLPIDVTMSFSMIYEIIEWIYAASVGGSAGDSFLGEQGDKWDAHKDMALATLGAFISMTVVALINWRFDKDFGNEFRQSLRVKQQDPLGEVKLAELRNGRKSA